MKRLKEHLKNDCPLSSSKKQNKKKEKENIVRL